MRPNQLQFVTLAFGVAILLSIVLWIVSCSRQVVSPLGAPTPVRVAMPVTVEVTRIVERLVVATPEPPATCVRGELASANEIVIGALVPLSRPGALVAGFAMQAAFTLAVDGINGRGGLAGKPVRLVTYDTANSAERGALYAQRLIALDCAAVLVGGYHNPVALAIKDIAHRNGIPVIFTAASADELTQGQYAEVFRIAPSVTMLAQMPGKWLSAVGDFNQDGKNFVILIAEEATETLAMLAQVEKWLSSYGVEIEAIFVDLPTNDFSSVIARIVALEQVPDAIFIELTGETAFDLQQQMLNAHIGPQKKTLLVTNANALNDQIFWPRVPGGVYTVVSKMGPWYSTVTAAGARFAESYRPYFDRWPEASAFAAYDAIHLALDAIGRANSLAPADIIAALERSDVELAAGRYTFPYNSSNPPDGKEIPAYLWHQWLDTPLLYLQYSEPNQPASAMPVIWPSAYRTVDTAVLRPPEN